MPIIPTRCFSLPNYVKEELSKENTKLVRLQQAFENDPTNLANASLYFRELNRLGKCNTVVRLYEKNEVEYRKAENVQIKE